MGLIMKGENQRIPGMDKDPMSIKETNEDTHSYKMLNEFKNEKGEVIKKGQPPNLLNEPKLPEGTQTLEEHNAELKKKFGMKPDKKDD